MSANTIDGMEQGVTTDGTERRIAPPVLQLSADDVEGGSLGEVEGSIIVFYSDEADAMETFDRAVRTGETAGLDEWVASEIAENMSATGTTDEPTVSADVTYHGRTIATDLELAESDSFGVAVARYNGGELDEMGFKVDQTGEADVEYRVITVPPTLDEGEADAMEAIPEDTGEHSLRVTPESDLCGTAALAFAGAVLAGAAVASLVTDAALLEQSSVSPRDTEIGASVDELVEAQL